MCIKSQGTGIVTEMVTTLNWEEGVKMMFLYTLGVSFFWFSFLKFL